MSIPGEELDLIRERDRLLFASELASALLVGDREDLHLGGYVTTGVGTGRARLATVNAISPSQRGRLASMILARGRQAPPE